MTISFVGQATGTTSATLPAHIPGDLIIAFAFVDGSNTAATLPGGWTNISNDGANTCAGRIAWKKAASSSETSGTWTSATSVVFLVYRGNYSLSVGNSATNTASSTTVNYPALTLTDADGSSWVVGVAGHRSTNTALETPPTGMTNRATAVDATDEVAGHDTNGGVTSWVSRNVTAGGTASGYRSYVIEVVEASAPPPAGYRITESGDRRVTEASDPRITERFHSAAFTYVGPAATMFVALKRIYGVFGWTAAASATFEGAKVKDAAFSWQGSSLFEVATDGSSEGSFNWSAAASLSIAGSVIHQGEFDWTSGGAIFIVAGSTREIGFDWVTNAVFTPQAGLIKQAAFSFALSSSMAAEAKVIHNAAFDFFVKSNTNTRVTEDGQRRITQAGDTRIVPYRMFTPGFHFDGGFSFSAQAVAAFAGDVTITVSNVDVRYGGVWYDNAETYINDEGEWKQAVKIYAKDNGVWKLTR